METCYRNILLLYLVVACLVPCAPVLAEDEKKKEEAPKTEEIKEVDKVDEKNDSKEQQIAEKEEQQVPEKKEEEQSETSDDAEPEEQEILKNINELNIKAFVDVVTDIDKEVANKDSVISKLYKKWRELDNNLLKKTVQNVNTILNTIEKLDISEMVLTKLNEAINKMFDEYKTSVKKFWQEVKGEILAKEKKKKPEKKEAESKEAEEKKGESKEAKE